MPKTIQQTVRFPALPEALYELYMDSRRHGEATGGPARIGREVGSAFSAHDGYITGKTLHLEPGRVIVQTWRGKDWKKSDPDSILVLRFIADGSGTRLSMVHAHVPDEHYPHLREGWHQSYWNRWKAYLKKRK
jgi:uncharacterized protein YndB with AHSA1/START domain